ncbi:MAG: cardiolipin synthase [Alphaproteobacteria bacterium]|nr:cardiolipin synthase [Alphaproteobacteria bacterium]MBO6628632.1 cardiolipin synthase [Alphaproteobacteria bacterium]MDF1626850.1 cardiolipin synthase [Parvibaculaceae bacterium]
METEVSLELWPFLVGAINLFAATFAAGHALLTKRDVRAAIAWLGVIILLPVFGWAIYLVLGINRIARRAQELRAGVHTTGDLELPDNAPPTLAIADGAGGEWMMRMTRIGRKIADTPYTLGNDIRLLRDGDEAYPAMLEAIGNAKNTIALSTYIFNNDTAGKRFLAALKQAHERGVKVRVLIDGVGAWYSFPSMIRRLRQADIPHARFLHSFLPWQMPYLNLRNHQKILVIDGQKGFTGSMNIAEGNLIAERPRHPIHDYHFAVDGPVVSHLMAAFAHEWRFSTGEILTSERWMPQLQSRGQIAARGLPAGPDMSRNTIRWTILAALTEAREQVRIVTPYFLPDAELITALSLAAMRGVSVDIVLPGKNNLAYMTWATRALLDELIQAGCRIWKSTGPFDHAKLMTVDRSWSLVGSANWDPRSLRLNFEFNLECYSVNLAAELNQAIDTKIATATAETAKSLKNRALSTKLRDNIARLMSPYL